MDTRPLDLGSDNASEDAPLIDFAQDVARDEGPESENAHQPPVVQEPTTPQTGSPLVRGFI